MSAVGSVGPSNTIHFKFRSATTFDTILIPGTMARIFDVKRAIILKKKMGNRGGGSGGIEFDLSVVNASTNEEYNDENKMIPRGCRVVVHRLPATRGMGLLARIARAEAGGNATISQTSITSLAPAGHYDVKGRDKDEEFVDTAVSFSHSIEEEDINRKALEEEEALQRAVSGRAGLYRASGRVWMQDSGTSGLLNIGSGASALNASKMNISASGVGGGEKHANKYKGQGIGGQHFQKPNADPELRSLEPATKKRATGIPRTFLNFLPPTGDNSAADDNKVVAGVMEAPGGGTATLQPNHQAFLSLLSRSGGKSNRGDLTLALKKLGKTLPDYFKCAICFQLVRDAVMLKWDEQGRNVCDTCIRSALTAEHGFHCPVTGVDGVTPDDLIVNLGLRKAATDFVSGIMSELEELEKKEAAALDSSNSQEDPVNVETQATNMARKRQRANMGEINDGGLGDDFGGDVFDMGDDDDFIEPPEITENKDKVKKDTHVSAISQLNNDKIITGNESLQGKNKSVDAMDTTTKFDSSIATNISSENTPNEINTENHSDVTFNNTKKPTVQTKGAAVFSSTVCAGRNATSKSTPRVRGPPPGYASGPAMPSAALSGPPPTHQNNQTNTKGHNSNVRGRGYGHPHHNGNIVAGRGLRDGPDRCGRGSRWNFQQMEQNTNRGVGRSAPHTERVPMSMHGYNGGPGYHSNLYDDSVPPQSERKETDIQEQRRPLIWDQNNKEQPKDKSREEELRAYRTNVERLKKRSHPNMNGKTSFDHMTQNHRFGPNGSGDPHFRRGGGTNQGRGFPPPSLQHHYGQGHNSFHGRGPLGGNGRGWRVDRRR
uniref:DWNN domain-containing protein n=1 Tax=Corethron hystrix TaxID=216773 RepID=A0A6U5J3F1_9STRA|mmetsp:Transcript_35920/g.83782  ORF Transcript_35920/g.83782 Transcript_35920/m.83782 type:complete len:831 (+) Transcript_35920:1040-3532(+)